MSQKPNGLREEIVSRAQGTYQGAIIGMAMAICSALDQIFIDAPLEVRELWIGKQKQKNGTPDVPECTSDNVSDKEEGSTRVRTKAKGEAKTKKKAKANSKNKSNGE